MNCYICGCKLNVKNSSEEHIIPNALGGKLKARILCKKCNNILGNQMDASLAKSLEFFSFKVKHSRDRGTVPNIYLDLEGKKVIASPNGDFITINNISKIDSNTFHFHYMGTNIQKKFKKDITKIANNLVAKNKLPKSKQNSFIDKTLELAKQKTTIIENPILYTEINFSNCFLGLTKIAVNFAIYNNIESSRITEGIINGLKQNNIELCKNYVNLFYFQDIFPKDSIYHTIILSGDRKEQLLYCLISLYGVCNGIILLSDQYSGESFCNVYCYDIWNEKERDYQFFSNIDKKQIVDYLSFDNKTYEQNKKGLVKALNRFYQFFVIDENYNQLPTIYKDIYIYLIRKIALNDNIYSKQEFLAMFKQSIIKSRTQLTGNKFLKDKDLIEIINKNQDSLYNIYLSEATKIKLTKLFTIIISQNIEQHNFKYPLQFKMLIQTINNEISSNQEIRNSVIYDKIIDNINSTEFQELIRCALLPKINIFLQYCHIKNSQE